MRLSTELTWERFVIDLELLLVEDPSSLAPLALSLNQILLSEEGQDQSLRNINFMCYELMSRCQDKDEEGRLKELLNYFFEEKGFQVIPPSADGWTEDDLLLGTTLQNRVGSPLALALVFLHLASQLDLPIYLVHIKRHCVVKWVRAGRSCFLDLTASGNELTQEQLLKLINKSVGSKTFGSDDGFEILPSKKVFLRYAEELGNLYKQAKDSQRLHTILNTRLVIDTTNLEILAERALLRQRLGYIKEALQDLKRYFSFVDKEHAPSELQAAFHQMQNVQDFAQRNNIDFLH